MALSWAPGYLPPHDRIELIPKPSQGKGLVQDHTVLSGEWGLASPALVPGTQQQRPVWVPGFPQMFESQAKGCPRQAQALPPGSCVTLDKSVSASPCPHVWPGQTCPCSAWPAAGRGPGLLWRAVYRAMPGVRAGSRGSRAPCCCDRPRSGAETRMGT